MLEDVNEAVKDNELSAAERAKIEKNRQKALLLRHTRVVEKPLVDAAMAIGEFKQSRVTDSRAGFFIENCLPDAEVTVVYEPGPVLQTCSTTCELCGKVFCSSFLLDNFECSVCDSCRKDDEEFALIARTDAKSKFLLKDSDLDSMDPPLKFMEKRNPHNNRSGEMKLYIFCQVRDRAMRVWGSEEGLEEALAAQNTKRSEFRKRRYEKKVKELRKQVRSSLYSRKTAMNRAHVHEFGPEVFDARTDIYKKTCSTCGYEQEYEKM